MAKIMFLLALGVIIGAGGAVDEIWWMKSMNTWSTIESGFETISDPTSSRYDQYNANCNINCIDNWGQWRRSTSHVSRRS